MPGATRRVVFLLVSCFLVLFLALSGVGNGVSEPLPTDVQGPDETPFSPSINGIWYLGWTRDAYNSSTIPEELMRLKTELAVNYVGIVVPLYQDSLTSTDPHPDPNRTPSLATLAYVTEQAHEYELEVVLLPYLRVDSQREFEGVTLGNWVGDLEPDDVGTWFDSWRVILRDCAAFAEKHDVEILLLGWEFESMLTHHDEWQRTIAQLRDLYSGKLSYLTNWWADRDEYARVLSWTPWLSLDFIGVSAYFELTRNNDPTFEELEQAWYEDANHQNIVADLKTLSAQHGKPIVFWELGYQSKDGTNKAPWNFVRQAAPDEGEQADAFAAAFQVLGNRPWFAGQVIWGEDVGLRKARRSYTVLNKKAATILNPRLPNIEDKVGVTFYEVAGTTVGMFTNATEATVDGFYIEFDREVTIVRIIEFGGYLPMFGERTGTTFNFGKGELIGGGMVELDWKPADARPVFFRW